MTRLIAVFLLLISLRVVAAPIGTITGMESCRAPACAMNNAVNRGHANVIPLGENAGRQIELPPLISYKPYLLRSQLSRFAFISTRAAVSPLAAHVSVIVGTIPVKQMIWINTCRIIAVMENALTELAKVKQPRSSMRQNSAVSASTKPDLPIPRSVF